jgi:hypothetical protein
MPGASSLVFWPCPPFYILEDTLISLCTVMESGYFRQGGNQRARTGAHVTALSTRQQHFDTTTNGGATSLA